MTMFSPDHPRERRLRHHDVDRRRHDASGPVFRHRPGHADDASIVQGGDEIATGLAVAATYQRSALRRPRTRPASIVMGCEVGTAEKEGAAGYKPSHE